MNDITKNINIRMNLIQKNNTLISREYQKVSKLMDNPTPTTQNWKELFEIIMAQQSSIVQLSMINNTLLESQKNIYNILRK